MRYGSFNVRERTQTEQRNIEPDSNAYREHYLRMEQQLTKKGRTATK